MFAPCIVTALVITKTSLYNFDLLNPHFYTVKPGFTGVYNIFLFSAEAVLTSSTIYVLSRNMKNIRVFLSENFQFLGGEIFYIFE